MNKTNLKSIFIIGIFVLFSAVSVSQAQVALKYTQDLYFGIKNSSVSTLQSDLSTDSAVYPEKLVTGYFGALTQKAVQRFQAKYGIVSSGTPSTTGYGRMGPKTRAKLNELYGEAQSNSQNCKIPLPYDDKNITSVDCVIGTYSPEQVIALAENLNGKPIEISGAFSMQPILVEQTPGGPVAMPTGGPAFHATDSNIYMNSAGGVNTVEIGSKVKIRGTFMYKPELKSKGQYAGTYFLLIPIYCSNCLSQ